jgi:tetratricopeptide (TPR) repeat protein
MRNGLIVVLGVVLTASCALADYPADRKAALTLANAGKNEEAMAAFAKMAEGKVTDFQKSDALEQAVLCAIRLKKYDQAAELAKQIPMAPVSKLCQMRILMDRREWQKVVDTFKDEDLSTWPDNIIGEAAWTRGQAALYMKNGEQAVKDLSKAPDYLNETNAKGLALIDLGNAYVMVKNDDAALDAFRKVYATGNVYKHCYAAAEAAGILVRQGKLDEATKELDKVDLKAADAKNYWVDNLFIQYGNILAKQGKKSEAAAKYNEALKNKDLHPSLKSAAEAGLKALEAN